MERRSKERRLEEEPKFYTVQQLAELLQVTKMTIYRLIQRGELPYYAIGRLMRFRQSDVEEFLKRQRRARRPAPHRRSRPRP